MKKKIKYVFYNFIVPWTAGFSIAAVFKYLMATNAPTSVYIPFILMIIASMLFGKYIENIRY